MGKISERLDRVLSPTGKAMSFIGRMWDYVLVGLYWLIASLPLVTVGAASAALYTVVFRMLNQEDDRILSEFVTAFKDNFRQGTVLWLLQLLLGAFFALDIYFYLLWAAAGQVIGMILLGAFLLATIAYWCATTYLYAYIAKFRCRNMAAVKNSLVLSLRHLPYTLLMILADTVLTVACLATGFLIIALPGAVATLNGWCIKRVFDKYIPKAEAPETEA